MRVEDFDLLSGMLKERSGLVLGQDKAYLLESRLTPVARKHGLNGLDDLVGKIRGFRDETLLREVTEAMTTNESLFFRDIKPFDILRQSVLPRLLEARGAERRIRIWSAACSSGQEPYSICMVLKEAGALLSGWRVEIVATDLSDEMLEKAKAGIYSQFEVQRGLPITHLVKYFQKVGDKWQVDAALRGMIDFRKFNLLDDPVTLGRFDVIFCRNVLIYFDGPTKSRVLDRMSRLLPDDGVLYLGGAETVLGLSQRFEPVPEQRGVYRLAGEASPAPRAAAS